MPVEADNKADISSGAGQTRGTGSEDGEASGQQGRGGPGACCSSGCWNGKKPGNTGANHEGVNSPSSSCPGAGLISLQMKRKTFSPPKHRYMYIYVFFCFRLLQRLALLYFSIFSFDRATENHQVLPL